MTDGAGPVPAAETLERLGPDDWAMVLRHTRAVLNELGPDTADSVVRRLRSAPTSRLAAGRMRSELCRVVADRAGVWSAVRDRLADDPAAAGLHWLIKGEDPPASIGGDDERPSSPPSPQRDARRDRRVRELIDERDAALRRLTGAETRARRAEAAAEHLRAEIEPLMQRIAELEQQVDEGRAEVEQAVQRERRRVVARIAELEEQLTELRREDDRRRRTARGQERSRDAAGARDAAGHRPAPAPSGRALAGRPSRLPADVTLDAAEGVKLLLSVGRTVLVDGYNVTRTSWPDLPFEQQRQRLRATLERAATAFDLEITVVFDGRDEGSHSVRARVRQRFTAEGVTADDDIVFLVEALPTDQPAVVVTDDAELRERLRPYHVDLVHTRPFLWAVG